MLILDDIKKIHDNFEIQDYALFLEDEQYYMSFAGDYSFDDIEGFLYDKALYKLYLQKVVEALQLTPNRWISIELEPDGGGSCAWRPKVDLNYISEDVYLDTESAKEVAIRYVIERI